MDKTLIVICLAMFGLVLGSFAGAQVWRLRARQLVRDRKQGEDIDETELVRLRHLDRDALRDRSECLHCHHQLAWYDMVPIISWIVLAGKCRYCKRSIGSFEPLIELGLATAFVASYVFWPFTLDTVSNWALLMIWLVSLSIMAILFAYDAKWYLLPFVLNVVLIGLGLAFVVWRIAIDGHAMNLWSLVGAVFLLAGLYAAFALFGWVGFGDSILGVSLALFLGRWDLAFLALFLANALGCLMLIPLAAQHKLHRGAHIPFGPFLILGMCIAFLLGDSILTILFGVSNIPLIPLMV